MKKNLKGKSMAAIALSLSMLLAQSPVANAAISDYNYYGNNDYCYTSTTYGTKAAEAADTSRDTTGEDTIVYEKRDVKNVAGADNRANLVASLRADYETRIASWTSLIQQMLSKQLVTILQAESDSSWRQIASGNYTINAETRAEAQSTISENGYWGIEQTSGRIFDVAYAIAGDDLSRADELLAAFRKAYSQTSSAYGKEMPRLSQRTYDAVVEKFENWMNEIR